MQGLWKWEYDPDAYHDKYIIEEIIHIETS